MPEDLKLLQIGSSQLPPPFRGLHSPGVVKHCQIIFACYFWKSSISKQISTGMRGEEKQMGKKEKEKKSTLNIQIPVVVAVKERGNRKSDRTEIEAKI